MQQVYFGDMNLTLRDCNIEDAGMLLNWRNLKKVRNFSHNADEIDSTSHENWLRKRLIDIRMQPFWIILSDEKSAGYVRFDYSKKHPAALDVSILIAEEYQGLGIALQSLTIAIERVHQDSKIRFIYADVHMSNLNSIKLFEKYGFEFISEEENFSTFKYLIERV